MSRERLLTERNVWMSTVRDDGRPHVAPIWFVYLDDRFWIGTGAGSVRVRNLSENPLASVALEDGDRPVVAECVVRIHETERPPAVVDAFAEKFGWDIRRPQDVDVGRVVVLEATPRKWLFGLDLPTPASD
ncbi:MAG: pyridoxamine 5'-phosphate oxidase family protein [Actinomycetota bacterium]